MILRLDKTGLPLEWIQPVEAAHFMANDNVAWSMGQELNVLRGGINNQGVQSTLSIPSIIATKGNGGIYCINKTLPLTNRSLFLRDGYMCMYCGHTRETGGANFKLTRDHVYPVGQGGLNIWSNVVTACFRCNNHKACRTPSEADMKLLAVPFTPNYAEALVLKNRQILADQMDFLRAFCKHDSFLF